MRDIQSPGRSVVMAMRAMVATSQPMATAVALEVLRRGGNALDAAVAASATLCVTEPLATGIGGDCFLLYHEAATGQLHALNGSGRAPARATPEALRARGLAAVPERGILSVSVPGAVDAWQTAVERFGRFELGTLLAPAIDYAQEGFAVTPVVASGWRNHEALFRASAASTEAFLVGGKESSQTPGLQVKALPYTVLIGRDGRFASSRLRRLGSRHLWTVTQRRRTTRI